MPPATGEDVAAPVKQATSKDGSEKQNSEKPASTAMIGWPQNFVISFSSLSF